VVEAQDPELSATLASDPRFARNPDRVEHRTALDAYLQPLFARRTVSDWRTDLQAAGIPADAIATVPEALESARLVEHPHPTQADAEPVRSLPPGYWLDGAPFAAPRRAPGLGEHTHEVQQEWL